MDVDDQGSTIGATNGAAPAVANGTEQVEKDRAESPGSERETEVRQNQDPTTTQTETSGSAEVVSVPGTGGADDVGTVEVDPDEVSLNGKPFPGHAGTK